MRTKRLLWIGPPFVILAALGAVSLSADPGKKPERGVAVAEETRPRSFPHRIWAACDFEGQAPDYAWFGPPETKNIPKYPGNATALGVKEKPYQNFAGLMTGINPVPGPMMGKVNKLSLRYFLRGATEATFQHFSLTTEDNNHVRVSGLAEGQMVRGDGKLHPRRQAQRRHPRCPVQGGRADGRLQDLRRQGEGRQGL